MAVATAKWWGILPHTIWRYPFRYYKELRDAYVASLLIPLAKTDELDFRSEEAKEKVVEFDKELFRGDAL